MADIDAPLSWRMQQDGYLMQIDQLRTENANIRDGFHVMQQLYEDELKHALDENAELRELVRDYHTFLALADLAQPIGHIIAASGHPTLSVESLDSRYRELGVDE